MAGGIFTYVFKDKIIVILVAEINKQLDTKIEVEKIDLSIIEKFPQIAITFNGVSVHESLKPSKHPLLKANKIFFTFNIFDLLNENYTVKKLHVEHGEAIIRFNKAGEGNFNIFKKNDTSADQKVRFELNNISLFDFEVSWINESNGHHYKGWINHASAQLHVNGDQTKIDLDSDIQVEAIKIDKSIYFEYKKILADARFIYDANLKKFTIIPSAVEINTSKFDISGYYSFLDKSYIDLKVDGRNTDFQTILSILPINVSNSLSGYKSNGDVYFNAEIKGGLDKQGPGIQIDFGSKKASFFHPDIKNKIEKISFTGQYSNGKGRSLNTSSLKLSDVCGQLMGLPFKSNIFIQNFTDPYFDIDFEGSFDFASLLQFFPLKKIKKPSGHFEIYLQLSGKYNDLKKYQTAHKVKAGGEFTLKDISFNIDGNSLDFRQFNGNFIFNKNDLAINNFSGEIGNSDFLLNGIFKNAIPYLISPGQPVGIDARLHSSSLDFDELLKAQKTSNKDEDIYAFSVSPDLNLKIDTDIKQVKFRRFRGKNIQGGVKLKNQYADLENIRFLVAGGTVSFNGFMDAHKPKKIIIEGKSNYDRINVDSLFYIFEDFNQNFISYKNLKGIASADIHSYVELNSQLEPDYDQLKAEIAGAVKNGALLNFEPMQKLSRFLDEKELANLKFSQLNNTILVYNKVIYIPEMEIKSNIYTMSISGTHTFDQAMDYKLKIPMSNFKKPDKDAAFGAIKYDGLGKSTLFLTIKGTTENYKIAYDVNAVKQKVAEDLKKEKETFKDIFRKTSEDKKTEQKTLNEDEYFDF